MASTAAFDGIPLKKIRYFILVLVPILLSSCLGTRHLEDGQRHLYRQKIKAPRNINEEVLRELYAQRTNRRFLYLPFYHLVAMYYAGEKRYDTAEFVHKRDKVEDKFNARIERSSSQRRINNLQFRKQK